MLFVLRNVLSHCAQCQLSVVLGKSCSVGAGLERHRQKLAIVFSYFWILQEEHILQVEFIFHL